jgi:hypothetical protein
MTPLGRVRRWYDVDLDAFRLTAPAEVVSTVLVTPQVVPIR